MYALRWSGRAVAQPENKGTANGAKINSRPAPLVAGRVGGKPPLDPRQQLAARALAGHRDSLDELLARPDLEAFAASHRIAAALALACRRAGVRSYPAAFDRELYWATGRNLLVNEAMRKAGGALGEAGIPWVIIKGADLATRVYDHPCERVFTDVDMVVKSSDLGSTLACLAKLGWLPEGERDLDPDRLLGGERYVVTVGHGSGVLVELHYRLWGWMPAAMSDALVDEAEPRPDRGVTARRPTLPWAFLLAAVHAWQVVRPRPVAVWRDLERIAATASDDLAAGVACLAERWAVQLPVGLAAGQTACLWPLPVCAEIASRLLGGLRPPEVLAAHRFTRRGESATHLALLVLARLLARRPSRLGWRSVGQVFWPADEVVATLAPPGAGHPRRLAVIWRSIFRAMRQ